MQVQLAASRAIRAWKGEAVYSPPKNGLAVSFFQFSPSKKKETVNSDNDRDQNNKLQRFKNS